MDQPNASRTQYDTVRGRRQFRATHRSIRALLAPKKVSAAPSMSSRQLQECDGDSSSDVGSPQKKVKLNIEEEVVGTTPRSDSVGSCASVFCINSLPAKDKETTACFGCNRNFCINFTGKIILNLASLFIEVSGSFLHKNFILQASTPNFFLKKTALTNDFMVASCRALDFFRIPGRLLDQCLKDSFDMSISMSRSKQQEGRAIEFNIASFLALLQSTLQDDFSILTLARRKNEVPVHPALVCPYHLLILFVNLFRILTTEI